MGVKWTCALICLLVIIDLSVEAKNRNRRASDPSPALNRMKRDAGHSNEHSHSSSGGGKSYSWSSGGGSGSSSSSSGSSSSSSGMGAGYSGNDWSHYQHRGSGNRFQNPGQGWYHHGYGPNVPNYDYRNNVPNVRSYPYYPNQNSGPFNVPSFNFDDFVQQYFRNLHFQQLQFESQFQNQFQPKRRSWAHAAASMTGPNGGVQPNARVYANSWSSTPLGTTGQSNFGAGHSRRHNNVPNRAVHSRQRFSGQNNGLEYGSPFNNYDPNPNSIGSRGAFGPGFGNFDGFNRGFPNSAGNGVSNFFSQPAGGNSAFASAQIGPDGGFERAEISPGAPGIESRFAQDIPPSGGNTFRTFSTSHSSSETDSTGKQINRKSATVGVNNNGKVSIHTVHDP